MYGMFDGKPALRIAAGLGVVFLGFINVMSAGPMNLWSAS
jgi:hypothetical protein